MTHKRFKKLMRALDTECGIYLEKNCGIHESESHLGIVFEPNGIIRNKKSYFRTSEGKIVRNYQELWNIYCDAFRFDKGNAITVVNVRK